MHNLCRIRLPDDAQEHTFVPCRRRGPGAAMTAPRVVSGCNLVLTGGNPRHPARGH